MKQKYIFVSAIVAVAAILFYVLNPGSPPTDSIGIDVNEVSAKNVETVKIEIAMTNRLHSPLLYYADGTSHDKSPIFFSAFKSNELWQYMGGQTGVSGLTEMPGHASFKSEVQLPRGIKSAKVAVSVTILTWRGELAWYLMGTRSAYALTPVIDMLMHSDKQKRSVTVWSKECMVEGSRKDN